MPNDDDDVGCYEERLREASRRFFWYSYRFRPASYRSCSPEESICNANIYSMATLVHQMGMF